MLPDVAQPSVAGSPVATLRIGRSAAALLTCHATQPFERDQIATSALRALAGDECLTIARRPSGRPRLLPPYPELGVSLARRPGMLLAGFSPDLQIGVDVELASPNLDPRRLAADHFAPTEAKAVARADDGSPDEALDLFLRLWVAKEAMLKATGRGIYDGVDWPDLSAQIPSLSRDGEVFDCHPSAHSPNAAINVSRTSLADGTRAYIALAVLRS